VRDRTNNADLLRFTGWTLTLTAFLLGPGTGITRAVHLAQAGHHHASHSCPLCAQIALNTKADAIEPPTALVHAPEFPSLDLGVPAPVHLPTFEYAPLAPRAPPAS